MPRKEKKFHFIYKTTCISNKKYYYGMHSTDNIDDGYLGSGKRLAYTINKYGKENHIREIVEYCLDRKSLKIKEKEIINSDMVLDPLCMNLKTGGDGGWDHINGTEHSKKLWLNQDHRKFMCEMSKNIWKTEEYRNKQKLNPRFTGKKHNKETITKISKANKVKLSGINNSQYGTRWITDGIKNIKIRKGDLIPDKWKLGRINKYYKNNNVIKNCKECSIEFSIKYKKRFQVYCSRKCSNKNNPKKNPKNN